MLIFQRVINIDLKSTLPFSVREMAHFFKWPKFFGFYMSPPLKLYKKQIAVRMGKLFTTTSCKYLTFNMKWLVFLIVGLNKVQENKIKDKIGNPA